MHVDLITTTKGTPKIIHGTENGKKTACGINLTKPENIGHFASTGEMTDVIQMTCEKCKTVIAKKLIKESNREMAAQLKEEQRQLKRERAASKHHHGEETVAPQPVERSGASESGGYIPPSMRRAQAEPRKPIEAPTPAPPKPVSVPAPAPVSTPAASDVKDALSQFAIPAVPSSVPRTPAPAPAPAANEDVLAQFAIPTVPTSVPGMPQPAPAPAPAPAKNDDVLAQFSIPSVPTSVPSMPAPAPAPAPAANEDVLSQFAIPTVPTSVPRMPQPAPNSNDVLAQFAIPSVPSSVPQMPAPQPAPADDVLAQFNIPASPNTIPVSTAKNPPADAADDLLAQFSIPNPTVHQAQSVPELKVPDVLPSAGSGAVMQNDILAQFSDQPGVSAPLENIDALPRVDAEIAESTGHEQPHFTEAEEIVEVTPMPAPDDYDPFAKPKTDAEKTAEELLDDLLLMPGVTPKPAAPQPAPAQIPAPAPAPAPVSAPAPAPANPLPDLVTVPTSAPVQSQTAGFQQNAVPTLDVPTAPPVQPAPQIPVPPAPQPNLFSVPQSVKPQVSDSPTPLFVGYGADGRQIFQKFDALGNPIPINEPVYSAPPEQPKNTPLMQNSIIGAVMQGNGAPVMDMDELMAKMGIDDPAKKKADEGKAINYMEYKIPEKKKKKSSPRPAAATQKEPEGPISAAEAKRRKKVDKINKEFEKQLRARGIDPKTGGIIVDK